MKWKRVLIGTLCLLAYLALVVWLGFIVHFSGEQLVLFCTILGLLGLAALLVTLWYLGRLDRANSPDSIDSSPDSVNLHALLRDAGVRFRSASRSGHRHLTEMPMLYVVGDENSAKTQTVIRSGLDPELLAGAVQQDQAVIPTQLVNLWLSGSWLIGEAGGALMKRSSLGHNSFVPRCLPGWARPSPLTAACPPASRWCASASKDCWRPTLPSRFATWRKA